jgi:hypothetical protein
LEELAGACEIVVAAAQYQRPPELDSAAGLLGDLDRRILANVPLPYTL